MTRPRKTLFGTALVLWTLSAIPAITAAVRHNDFDDLQNLTRSAAVAVTIVFVILHRSGDYGDAMLKVGSYLGRCYTRKDSPGGAPGPRFRPSLIGTALAVAVTLGVVVLLINARAESSSRPPSVARPPAPAVAVTHGEVVGRARTGGVVRSRVDRDGGAENMPADIPAPRRTRTLDRAIKSVTRSTPVVAPKSQPEPVQRIVRSVLEPVAR